jgi:peptidoglycan hydrolase-like protein with peptidoglycan-binding domain
MKKLFVVFLGVLLLLPFSASAADLKYGMKNNEEVRQVQQYLKDGRYYKGDVTGNFYSVTLAAVKKFQKANGLKVTGVWNALYFFRTKTFT